MYHKGLFIHINTIISDGNIHVLNSFNEPAINKKIILIALKIGNALSYCFITPFTEQLKKITIHKKTEQFIRQHKQTDY